MSRGGTKKQKGAIPSRFALKRNRKELRLGQTFQKFEIRNREVITPDLGGYRI